MENKTKLIMSKTEHYNRYVAVEGCVDDWACYVGKKTDSVEYIKDYGDKIRESKARELFPEFEHLTWRP